MKMMSQHLLLIGLCLMSPGCASEIHVVQEYRAAFVCDGNQLVQINFTAGAAVLEFQGESVAMIQQSGDGDSLGTDRFLYRGDGQSLRQHGYDANWTDGKGAVHHCRRDAAASPKTDATAR